MGDLAQHQENLAQHHENLNNLLATAPNTSPSITALPSTHLSTKSSSFAHTTSTAGFSSSRFPRTSMTSLPSTSTFQPISSYRPSSTRKGAPTSRFPNFSSSQNPRTTMSGNFHFSSTFYSTTIPTGSQMRFSTLNTIITTPRRKRWAGSAWRKSF